MLTPFVYQIPDRFNDDFKTTYMKWNLRSIKVVSGFVFLLAATLKLLDLLLLHELIAANGYWYLSAYNWMHLIGGAFFYLLARMSLGGDTWSNATKKGFCLSFISFLLFSGLLISHSIAAYNTVLLLTIIAVSLFFIVEIWEISMVALLLWLAFSSLAFYKHTTIGERVLDVFAGLTFSLILIACSRYSYYFKGIHFTELKQLEERKIAAEELNTKKGEVLGHVAHDLITPLNNIKAISGLMLYDDIDNADAKLISEAAQQARAIIDDLIEVVKEDNGLLVKSEVELHQFLANICQKWRFNTIRHINLYAKEQPCLIFLNSSKMERVFDNLIGNAVKFSPEDRKIEVRVDTSGSKALVAIIDYGIGIPLGLQNGLFEKFSGAGRLGLRGEKSIGLGLHISRKIVEQHGGQLLVSSEENVKTIFTVSLPYT